MEDLREHLPGLEPERRITDWGRSERIESLVDRTLYEFLYHYWFRVEVDGAATRTRPPEARCWWPTGRAWSRSTRR